MKKSVLALMCAAVLVACKKNETTSMESNTDSSAMVLPADSALSMDSTGVSTNNNGAASMTDQDKMFADDAAKGGMMEVNLGQLAASNASNAKVKAFGEMMVKDHTKANDELKTWAASAGYNLPTMTDTDQQKMHDDLKNKTGADFDKAYMDMMVSHHNETIAKFQKQADAGGDANLKSWAASKIPTLQAHLSQAKETQNAVK